MNERKVTSSLPLIIVIIVAWQFLLYQPRYAVLHRSVDCNGNGIFDVTEAECNCFDCAFGSKCEKVMVDSDQCISEAGFGHPTMFEKYWQGHGTPLAIPLSDHLAYTLGTSHVLEKLIRELHEKVGNLNVSGKHIVIGSGSTSLIHPAILALLKAHGRKSGSLFARRPFYAGYQFFAEECTEIDFFHYETRELAPDLKGAGTIEMITSPNNPDGHARMIESQGAKIVDHAYFWPTFTSIDRQPSYGKDTIALFTLSKLTGHASTRIGWAVTDDIEKAKEMRKWIFAKHLDVPREPQLKAISVLDHLVHNHHQFFQTFRTLMSSRWQLLHAVFMRTHERVIENAKQAQMWDAYAEPHWHHPSPAYAWVRTSSGEDAHAKLMKLGIRSSSGIHYGMNASYARLQLMMRDEDFFVLLSKLRHHIQ